MKNQRRQQIGRDSSLYLTARFFSTFQIHKQVFLSFLLCYYPLGNKKKNVEKTEERNFNQYASISTHASISIRIHYQLQLWYFLCLATEKVYGKKAKKIELLISDSAQLG